MCKNDQNIYFRQTDKTKGRNFPIGNKRQDQSSLGLGKEFWDVDQVHQRQVRGEVLISAQSQQIQSQLLVCGTSERLNSVVERAFVGRVSSWMKPRKRKCWHTGSFFLSVCVWVCICVAICVFLFTCCVHICTQVNASCLYQYVS